MTQAVPVPGPPDGPALTAAVSAALQPLEQLQDRPVDEHVAVFDGVHRALQDALAALDGV